MAGDTYDSEPSDPVLQVAKADWPNTLQAREVATLSALCDMIIPADAKSPAASAVGAPAYINEWTSRPGGETSLVRVRGGLAWFDQTATAFYTTPQGWRDLGYIGNVAMPTFKGPNAEIRKQIGVA